MKRIWSSAILLGALLWALFPTPEIVHAQILSQILTGLNVTSGGGPTWAIVHQVADGSSLSNNLTCVTTVCTLTVPNATAGNVGFLIAGDYSGSSITMSSVTGGGTWTANPASFHISNGCCADLYAAYNTSMTATTSIVMTISGTSGSVTMYYWELSISGGTPSLDAANNRLNNSATTTQTGAAVTIGGTSDVVGQICGISTGSVTAAASPYNTNFVNTNSAAMATPFAGASIVINSASGAAASFTSSSASSVCATMALK